MESSTRPGARTRPPSRGDEPWSAPPPPSAAAGPARLRAIDLRATLDPPALFGRDAPLALEIGFGNGDFLLGLARRHPDWNFLAADLSPGSVVRTRARLRRAGTSHVALFHGDARFLMRDALLPRSLAQVHLNFPDPWPKGRHAGHRLLDGAFFRLLSSRLEEHGCLLFTTDHGHYFAAALEEAAASGLFAIEVAPPPPETLETKYARRWVAGGKAIHHARFTVQARDEGEPLPRVQIESHMHYATLSGTLPAPETFEKDLRRFEGGCSIVLDVLRPTRGGGLTFLVRVEEPDLAQELLVDAREKEPGQVFVGVRSFGQPLPTRGTREAVAQVAHWLEEQGLVIVNRSF